MTGQSPPPLPSLEETDNKKAVLRENEGAISHALNGPSIKICLAAECEGLLYFGHKQPPRCQRVSDIIDKHKPGMSSITLWVLLLFAALNILTVLVFCSGNKKGILTGE